MSLYLVDSNFFIQAHRMTYPLDVVPGFWTKIRQLANSGLIISLDKVKNEIYKHEDKLKDWCLENLPESFFKNSNQILSTYTKVVSWAVSKNNHYLQGALDEFLEADEADAWLVAYALAHETIIVTQEVSQPNRKNKIKIPDVCMAFGIPYKNTIAMFRHLGEQF